jgi:type IV pilus assembly protein PilZ
MSDYFPDRRESPRIPTAARVKFRDGDREEVWFTEDLSMGGLFLKTKTPPFVGTEIDLEISLPNADGLVQLRGEIVWRHEGHGCGVRFIRTTQKIRDTIQAFLATATTEG